MNNLSKNSRHAILLLLLTFVGVGYSFFGSHEKLIKHLQENGVIKSQAVLEAMLSVDRADFLDNDSPYDDTPKYIGFGATISAPHMHAHALELLKDVLTTSKRCLDVGSGSGYLSVAMAKMMPSDGIVIGIDHIPELVEQSILNVKKNHGDLLNAKVFLKVADGRLGDLDNAPFDCIHVGAASSVPPIELINQLSPGGKMVVPIGVKYQDYWLIEKKLDGEVIQNRLFGVMYVPLTSREDQLCKSQTMQNTQSK